MALIIAGAAADQSPRQTLIGFARSLSAAGFLPGKLSIRRIIRRDLAGTFHPAQARAPDPERWVSNDESCFAEVMAVERHRPLTRIMFGCRFTTGGDAVAFLREAATALGGPMVPPLADNIPRELHHRGFITAGARLIGVELHVIPDDTASLATVVLTEGARIVIRKSVPTRQNVPSAAIWSAAAKPPLSKRCSRTALPNSPISSRAARGVVRRALRPWERVWDLEPAKHR